MKSEYQQLRDDQLERKLSLLLGSPARGEDWLTPYAQWLADRGEDAETMQRYEDYYIRLFVAEQKAAA